jgi:hypothetical protein
LSELAPLGCQRGVALVLWGEPGIRKSAPLDDARAPAGERGTSALATRDVQSEAISARLEVAS